jgi:putative aminopeptidase FrvX
MKISKNRILDILEDLIETPSVVGYTEQIHPVLEEIVKEAGYEVEYDNRHTAYIKVPGKDSSKTVCLSAHLDTIGLVVRSIEDNGWLSVRNLGGINFHSIEGEDVIVHSRFDGNYEGMLICKSHSVHVFDNARELERDIHNMKVLLDAPVFSKEDVEKLGIRPGDPISVNPSYVYTDYGYIKSRHIDDKASAAVLLECLLALKEQKLTPAYDTWFAFPIYEEIGLGGAYVPEEIDEYVSLDIALIGNEQNGDERKVTIGAADNIAPYDWNLTNRLISLAKENDIDFTVDTFYRYGSDATAALKGGNNIAPAVFGMGCMSTHGRERTHMDGIANTYQLAMAYILDDSNQKSEK